MKIAFDDQYLAKEEKLYKEMNKLNTKNIKI
jgi:hypothetical protein